MSYWDTSCLIKLYTPEPDSAKFHHILARGAVCVTCDVTPLEFWAAVRRKESEGSLARGEARKVQKALEADIADESIVMNSCNAAVRSQFYKIVDRCLSLLPPILIRTNDALHLAAAHCSGESEIIATDKRLRDAASAMGFSVFPPL